MGPLLLTPQWFLGYNIILEVIFALITLGVSYYAWKIYRISDERNIRLFSFAFAFIGLSYVARALLNFIILDRLEDNIGSLVNISSLYLFHLFGTYLYTILFLIGILLLAYIALKIYSLQTFILLFILVFTSLYFTPYKTFMLYLLSTILLGFIVIYYVNNYLKNRKINAMLVSIAMLLLFAGYVCFIFSIDNAFYYFLGHLLELTAYLMILVNLLLILRLDKKRKNGKKTR